MNINDILLIKGAGMMFLSLAAPLDKQKIVNRS